MKKINSYKKWLIDDCIYHLVATTRKQHNLEEALTFALQFVPIKIVSKIRNNSKKIVEQDIADHDENKKITKKLLKEYHKKWDCFGNEIKCKKKK